MTQDVILSISGWLTYGDGGYALHLGMEESSKPRRGGCLRSRLTISSDE